MAGRLPSKSRLGRGLDSLISAPRQAAGDDEPYFVCPIASIDPMPGQPRKQFDRDKLTELSESIKHSGLIQPLVVRKGDGDRFTLIAGERRFRAAQIAGLTEVPVVVREVADADAFALALIENIQREDLNPMEEAHAYERLIQEHGFTQDDLATRVGKSRSTVANALRLLKLPESVRDVVAEGTLSPGHARAVLSVDPDLQAALAERILTEELSVREAEALARTFKLLEKGADAPPPSPAKKPELSPQLKAVQRQLVERLGTRVVLSRKKTGAGVIEVHFANDESLQAILDRFL
jgi:ParB family chromosome partitioning protein